MIDLPIRNLMLYSNKYFEIVVQDIYLQYVNSFLRYIKILSYSLIQFYIFSILFITLFHIYIFISKTKNNIFINTPVYYTGFTTSILI